MTTHVLEVEESVLRDGRELSLDTAARQAAEKLFARVAHYLGEGVKYPREAAIAYSWLQKEVNADHEVWVARAEISLHPVQMEVENPHSVPMDNQINEQAG
jgi:hypothetical protein